MYKNNYKSFFNSQIKDITEKGEVTVAVNAFGNVDSDKDISMEGSYDKTIKESFDRLKWFYNHNHTQLLGVPLEAKEIFPHLQVRAKMNLKKELSRDVYEDYKLYAENNKTLEHSVGVSPIKKEYNKSTGVTKVYEWKWWEFSTLSSWGANENTPLLDIKELKTPMEISEALDFLNKALKMNYTDERFEQIEITLNKLKSLTTEPEIPTQEKEPTFIQILNKELRQ